MDRISALFLGQLLGQFIMLLAIRMGVPQVGGAVAAAQRIGPERAG